MAVGWGGWGGGGAEESAPTRLVPKKNPDRTISVDGRSISDLRRIDLSFAKDDGDPAVAPTVIPLAGEIIRLKRLLPGINVVMRIRDVSGPFIFIYFHPHMSSVLATDFAAKILARHTT